MVIISKSYSDFPVMLNVEYTKFHQVRKYSALRGGKGLWGWFYEISPSHCLTCAKFHEGTYVLKTLTLFFIYRVHQQLSEKL